MRRLNLPRRGLRPVCVILDSPLILEANIPHGDLADIRGGRFADCGCAHCALTKNFLAFRDAIPPDRPATITTRLEAAQFLRWMAAELIVLVDAAKEEIEED